MEKADTEESPKELVQAFSDVVKKMNGTCPDKACNAQLCFYSVDDEVLCHKCLQNHQVDSLINRYETDSEDHQVQSVNEFGRDYVKVDGLSNFFCKLLSPFLTTFGMDKAGNAVPLQEIAGHADTLDCGKVLGPRSFRISPNHVDVCGYGKDQSGSLVYLAGLLAAVLCAEILKASYGGDERLLPIHVDGDGHCLVHALSRALTGRELFWHPLRKNLYEHLKQRLTNYTDMFRDFHDEEDFQIIIQEADPDAATGNDFNAGLGNIHIFALSNILKRPIMLLDSPQKMHNAGDYTGLFLPVLVDVEECKNKSPICIAWSGAAHNHFIPLVAVEGRPLPTIPSSMIPQIWGVSSQLGAKYLNYNDDGSLTVCDGKPIFTRYLQKLSSAMEKKFLEQHVISPSLVEDCGRYIYKIHENPALQPIDVICFAKNLASNQRLFRCLMCKALRSCDIDDDWFRRGGTLYELAVECHQKLETDKMYAFPLLGLSCKYSSSADRLEPVMSICSYCGGMSARLVREDNSIGYMNGDKSDTRNSSNGTKIYWEGTEYDNMPYTFNVHVSMRDQSSVEIPVVWFHGDSNPALNSDARTEAEKIVNEHFSELPDAPEMIEVVSNLLNEKCHELRIDCSPEFPGREKSFRCDQNGASSKPLAKKHLNPVSESVVVPALPVAASEATTSFQQSAYKRKSNGEPSEIHPNPVAPKLPYGDLKCIVKISQFGGDTKTIELDSTINMMELQLKIEELYNVPPCLQVLKHGFPPRILQAPPDGGPLGLKTGDKITLSVKVEDAKLKYLDTLDLSEQEISQPANFSAFQVEQEARKEELEKGFDASDCSSMWNYAMSKPELFYSGGYFYEQFKHDIGLKDRQHCHLPLLKGLTFCYSETHDRVELCLEPFMGHYPIDDETAYRYGKFLKMICSDSHSTVQPTPQILEKDNAANSRFESSSSQAHFDESKPTNIAPGYHTVGDRPTQLSEKEINTQRESIRQMVEKIGSKQSSS